MEIKEYVDNFFEAYRLLREEIEYPAVDVKPIAMEIVKERAKDRRTENISKSYGHKKKKKETTATKKSRGDKGELATQKQKNFMNQLSIDYSDDMTKIEASEKINKKLNEEKEDQE